MAPHSFGSKPIFSKIKGERREFHLDKLQEYAELKCMIKTLESAAMVIEAELKEVGFQTLVQMIEPTRVESFRAVDGYAVASVEMRRRPVTSPLNDSECSVLIQHGIIPEKKEVTQGFLAVNSAYATDKALMKRINAAILPFAPGDFFTIVGGTHKYVVTDKMLDFAYAAKDIISLRVMTTMAIKPTLTGNYPLTRLFTSVKKILSNYST